MESMQIKPINPVPKIQEAEIPQGRINRNQPRVPTTLKPPSGTWGFQKGQIILNGENIEALINRSNHMPATFWSGLANDLISYRNYYLYLNLRKRKKKSARKGELDPEDLEAIDDLNHLCAVVEAYLGKIMRILKKKYDETTDGLSFTLDQDNQLTLNGMNVTSFIAMAKAYPTRKALVFLRGIKNRLSIILSNKTGNLNYEKIREVTLKLFEEIDAELNRITEDDKMLKGAED